MNGKIVIYCFVATGLFLAAHLLRGELAVPKSGLIFSHALHVSEVEVDCMDCHETVSESDQAFDKNIPTHEVCFGCHDEVTDDAACGTCHSDPEVPLPVPNPGRNITFSHKNHIERDLKCSNCHRGVAETAVLSPENMPGMQACSTCHDDRSAPIDCSLCHSDPEGVRRASHPDGWRHKHKYQATQDDRSCLSCHPNTDYCLRCHEGDNLQQTSHPLNYRFTHTLDAKGKEKDCMVCHASQSFCYDCHRAEEVMPTNHSSATWPGRDHGIEASRDLETCAACHDEEDPTCLRCHRDLDDVRGTDPSPHGPGFSSERGKGPWHDDPGSICFRCHLPSAPFREPGFCRYCHAFRTDEGRSSPIPGGMPHAF